MTRESLLKWLERGLLAAGIGLAAWCAAVLVEARFHNQLPLRPSSAPLKVTQTAILPGDSGRGTTPAPSAGTLLGRLDAPTVKMSINVLEGSDDGTLRRGAGHIEDTPLPGQPGNSGVAGHRDTVFRPLRHIKVGDPLEFATANRRYGYKISKTLIVGPDDVYVLDPGEKPTLTLVTCYPFDYVGHAPKRFIVQAQLVTDEARTAATTR
jgi:sortase A